MQAYLSVAPVIATFPQYRNALVEHLLTTKLRHWERTLRELTSRALHALVASEPHLFVTSWVPQLLDLCLDKALEVKQPSVLGSGAVIDASCWAAEHACEYCPAKLQEVLHGNLRLSACQIVCL